MSDGGATVLIEVGKLIVPLLKRAFRVFFTTAIGLGLVACAMLYLSWRFAANAPWTGTGSCRSRPCASRPRATSPPRGARGC